MPLDGRGLQLDRPGTAGAGIKGHRDRPGGWGRECRPGHRIDTLSEGEPASRRVGHGAVEGHPRRSEEHTSELQSLMRISYDVFCLKTQNTKPPAHNSTY